MAESIEELKSRIAGLQRIAAGVSASTASPSYAERNRAAMARKSRESSAAVADIGQIPPVADPVRRERCRLNLLAFLTEYFPASTGLSPFGDDQLRLIERIEHCILHGGLFVEAIFRGAAKTTILENACIWAILYGHRKYIPFFAASAKPQAEGNIDSIKIELAENDDLYSDFPEALHAVRALEGKSQRCASQTHRPGNVAGWSQVGDLELSHIEWTAAAVVLPSIKVPDGWWTVEGAKPDAPLVLPPCAGGVVTAHGLTAASRGMKYKRPDGTQQRPDFVAIDDPQTDESAASPLQTMKRMDIIRKSILKMGGHKKKIACIIAATVICKDDLIDQLLDHKRHPEWQGERFSMVKSWSHRHEDLWLGDYATIRKSYDPDVVGDQRRAWADATTYYRENQDDMDSGCIVSWDQCYEDETEISAIQHAYNMLIDDGPDVFASEAQNQPLEPESMRGRISPRAIIGKINGHKPGVVPMGMDRITAFIDVQKTCLFWMSCAWSEDFTGAIIDYGAYPEQRKRAFEAKDASPTLEDVAPGAGLEGAVFAGLESLTDILARRKYVRDDGAELPVSRIMIDAAFKQAIALKVCRESQYSIVLTPARGIGIGATKKPMSDYTRKPGERIGHHWILAKSPQSKHIRHLLVDTNYWKSFVSARIASATGDAGSLSIFKANHDMLLDHLTAEVPCEESKDGRTVEKWDNPLKRENHWWDCLVGCAAAASFEGCVLASEPPINRKSPGERRRRKMSEIMRRRRSMEYA